MNYINFIIPEIFISISILFLLMIGVFYKKKIFLVYQLACFAFLIAILLILSNPFDTTILLFNNSYKIDSLSYVMKLLTLLFGLLVMILSYNYLKINELNKIEYPILILCSILGMMVMISSFDLMVFYIGLELQSLALYVLASFNRNNTKSSEAGLKYFVLSALSSGLLLYGCSLIYGFTGSTNFLVISQNLEQATMGSTFGIVFILVGLAFKISAVPFHMWSPDVYEGSPTSVTCFFSIVPKLAALTVFIRFLYIPFINVFNEWQIIIIFLSLSSMILGGVAAIGQSNIKRLMAYSSIGHVGYALAGLSVGTNDGIQNSLIYIIIYAIMTLGMFSCIFIMQRKNIFYENIEELSGLSKNHPIVSICMLISLFSLAGIPPLAGFFAKFYIFMSIIKSQMYFLAIAGLLTTVVSAFYYLRIIKIIYFNEAKEPFDVISNYGFKIVLFLTTVFTAFYFIYPSVLVEIIFKINLLQ